MTKDSTENRVLILVGPTAVGKTDLSLRLAERLGGEIVSADSRQVYRYMDIGTAKPTPEELARIPHHFINTRNPDEYYSAGEYGREARSVIKELLAAGKTPLVVGGSGFYIQALVDGLFAPKISDPEVKGKWRQVAAEKGNEYIYSYLQQIDPQSAQRLHPNDIQRVVRAIEVYEISGSPISAYKIGQQKPADFDPLFVGLTRSRPNLYLRIEERVDAMVKAGLVDEVRQLQQQGFGPELNALKTVGYKEVFEYLAGALSYEEMIDEIKKNSRRYAKRQITWFGKDERIHWIDLDQQKDNVEDKITELWGNHESRLRRMRLWRKARKGTK